MKFTREITTALPVIGDSAVEETNAAPRSNEERVIQLLSEQDGGLWQTDIVTETGWSKSKTSEVLCGMEEQGRITRYERGRRKIVFLPDRKPDFPNESR